MVGKTALGAQVWLDNRWQGAHGIGRYSSEVLQRLSVGSPIRGRVARPTSLRGMALSGTWQLRSRDLLYSPGFAPLGTTARQLLTVHDLIHLQSSNGRLLGTFYERVLLPIIRRCGHVITVSETSRLALEEWIGDSSIRVHNAGNGCSEAFVREGPVDNHLRDYLLFVGNLRPHKNLGVLMDAMRAYSGDLSLVLVLPPSDASEVARGLGELAKRVVVTSGIPDDQLARLYRGARALLFPSLVEGFGLPALEAQRCGCPVVYASTCHSAREICATAGLQVDTPSEPEAWLDAIHSLEGGAPLSVADTAPYEWAAVASRIDDAIRLAVGDINRPSEV